MLMIIRTILWVGWPVSTYHWYVCFHFTISPFSTLHYHPLLAPDCILINFLCLLIKNLHPFSTFNRVLVSPWPCSFRWPRLCCNQRHFVLTLLSFGLVFWRWNQKVHLSIPTKSSGSLLILRFPLSPIQSCDNTEPHCWQTPPFTVTMASWWFSNLCKVFFSDLFRIYMELLPRDDLFMRLLPHKCSRGSAASLVLSSSSVRISTAHRTFPTCLCGLLPMVARYGVYRASLRWDEASSKMQSAPWRLDPRHTLCSVGADLFFGQCVGVLMSSVIVYHPAN